jgi:predicted nucleic acid-binding protein
MVTAVDTSVLLDVLLNDSQHAAASMKALRRAAMEGSLILGEIVLAEVAPTLSSSDVPQFLSDWNLAFVPSSQASAILAGEMFRTYLQRGGKRGRVVPDFLVAAHAQIHAQRLPGRDRGFYRDCFTNLDLWDPAVAS